MENKKQQELDKPNIIGFVTGLLFVLSPIIRLGITMPAEMTSPIDGHELIALLSIMWMLGFSFLFGISTWSGEGEGFSVLNGFVSGIVLGSCGIASYYSYLLVQNFGISWG